MTSPDLHMFHALAVDLSKREARARAKLPSTEDVLGLGRYVLALGNDVGVFAKGTLHRSSGAPSGIVVSFVNRNTAAGHANVAGKVTYRPHEGQVTVTDNPVIQLSMSGLILALNGVIVARRLPTLPGQPFRVAVDELDYLADFVYGDPDHPTAVHSFHNIPHEPGQRTEGIVVSPVAGY